MSLLQFNRKVINPFYLSSGGKGHNFQTLEKDPTSEDKRSQRWMWVKDRAISSSCTDWGREQELNGTERVQLKGSVAKLLFRSSALYWSPPLMLSADIFVYYKDTIRLQCLLQLKGNQTPSYCPGILITWGSGACLKVIQICKRRYSYTLMRLEESYTKNARAKKEAPHISRDAQGLSCSFG